MKLPKELTTVTPFSKYLALVIFISFPIYGFLLGAYFQSLADMNAQNQYIINYIIPQPTITPVPTQIHNGFISCKTNQDCPTDYSCTQAGPIIYSPKTEEANQGKTCWRNGTAVPL